MLSVYHAIIGEEGEMERHNVEDLLQSNLTARNSEGFQTWFGSLSSLAWMPRQPPPTCLPSDATVLCEADDRTCEGTAEFSPQCVSVQPVSSECIRPSENITEDAGGISPLVKKMLKRGSNENVIIADYPEGKDINVKWCSCPLVKIETIHHESQGGKLNHAVLKEKMGRKLGNLGLSPNCRGKWVIQESDLNNGVCLEGLWETISEELSWGVVRGCNVSFQMDPYRILIYLDSLNCVTVLEHFSCIFERVKKMSYVVHPHGEVASWNGKEIVME